MQMNKRSIPRAGFCLVDRQARFALVVKGSVSSVSALGQSFKNTACSKDKYQCMPALDRKTAVEAVAFSVLIGSV
jgi:hypothetical protein